LIYSTIEDIEKKLALTERDFKKKKLFNVEDYGFEASFTSERVKSPEMEEYE